MIVRGYARNKTTGAAVPDTSVVEMRAELDNVLLASGTTTAGLYQFAFDGNPPPYKISVVSGGETKIVSSKVVGMAGPTSISGIPTLLRMFSGGVVQGVYNELAVTAPGASMTVSMATGAAVVRGIPYENFAAAKTITIAAADVTNPRIDTIAIEVVPPGAGENIEGRSAYVKLQGAPAATPVAPALTQSSTLFQIPIADVRVDAGLTLIAANKITDRRVFAGPFIPALSVVGAQLANATVGTAQLTDLGVTTAKVADLAVTAAKLNADVAEYIQDTINTALVAGANVTKTYDDVANTITVAVADENIDDRVAALIVAGANITKTYDDVANTLTLAAIIADGSVTDAKLALRYLQLTGGVLTNDLHLNYVNARIEHGQRGAANTPVIDFHSGATDVDFDSRLVASGGTGSSGNGTLNVTAGTFSHNGVALSLERATFMPGTAYAATGAQTNGVRTLVTMAVGPLVSGVTYDISCTHFCTLRGTGAGATASLRCNINGGVQRSEEFQVVDAAPRGALVTQSASVTGTGVSINVTGSVAYETGTSFDVRAGQITVIAIPR
ncbi:MAG TPA: hypothetical protein VNJ04_19710 [Gemmatimonadaceae bacterium]|nr:hypothetical protein [Gemmatimonadaceae bacterium]